MTLFQVQVESISCNFRIPLIQTIREPSLVDKCFWNEKLDVNLEESRYILNYLTIYGTGLSVHFDNNHEQIFKTVDDCMIIWLYASDYYYSNDPSRNSNNSDILKLCVVSKKTETDKQLLPAIAFNLDQTDHQRSQHPWPLVASSNQYTRKYLRQITVSL
jgi:hypothetical protein